MPTPTDGAVKTVLDQSLIQRVINGTWRAVSSPFRGGSSNPNPGDPQAAPGTTNTWMGPGSPMRPSAPESVKGRAFDYPIGTNITTKPRNFEAVSFQQLRGLADGLDLVRLAIETRKDQMAKLSWSIMPKIATDQASRPKTTPRCQEIEKFFQRPDGKNDWYVWSRMLLEDLFVIDAPSLYVRRRNDGGVYGFEIIDGSTIKVVLDQYGRTPDPPYPAFQQVLKGLPAVDYTADELIYRPRNQRPDKVYGHGPVEQIITTINIAIRREINKLQLFTEGNIPEAIIGVPPEWGVEQIKAFQQYWDALLEGNTAARRHAKFVPGGMQFQETRPNELLKDDFDEWIARVVCYAFSLPPLPFIRQMNRASAETAKETALEEGLEPLMGWFKSLIDELIVKYFGEEDVEFVWDDYGEQDPHTESQINTQYIQLGVKSIDEVRAELGLDPIGMDHAIWGIGPMGIMFVKDLVSPQFKQMLLQGAESALIPQQPAMPGQGGVLDGVPYQVMNAAGLPAKQSNPATSDPVVRAALGKRYVKNKRLAKRLEIDPHDYP